jgi:hypothetical protein
MEEVEWVPVRMFQVVVQTSCQPVVLENQVKVITVQHLHSKRLAEVAEPVEHQVFRMVEMVYLLVFPAFRLLMEAGEQDKGQTSRATPSEVVEVVAEVIFTLMEPMG